MILDTGQIDEHFPKEKYREHQKETLEKIIEAYSNGKDTVILQAPTGSGKTALGTCIANMSDSAYYTTPQVILQEQISKDFKVPVVKGRNRYRCKAIQGKSCEEGLCQAKKKYKCEYRETGTCEYYAARDQAILSKTACLSFSYLMTVRENLFPKRELLIIDEAHNIDQFALDMVSVTLKEGDVGSIPMHNDIDKYRDWMDAIAVKLDAEIDMMKQEEESDIVTLGLTEKIVKLTRIQKKLELAVEDIDSGNEWVFTHGHRKIQFQPVTSGRFLGNMLYTRGEKLLLMSGTMPKSKIKELDLENRDYEYIEVPSTFPVKNRPIYYLPVGKMNLDSRRGTIPALVDVSKKIISKHYPGKGIIHCGSYDIAKEIFWRMTGIVPEFFFIAEEYHVPVTKVVKIDGEDVRVILQHSELREQCLDMLIKSNMPAVLVSVNMTEGIDLYDDRCRYQIVAKVYFPYLGDKRVKKRVDRGEHEWYNTQALIDLIQSYGRGVRSAEDYCTMYILDQSFFRLYKKYNRAIPKYFKEAVRLINSLDSLETQ